MSDIHSVRADLFARELRDLAEQMSADALAAASDPRLALALERCPSCGGQPLREARSVKVRCGCGWTGVALRRLP